MKSKKTALFAVLGVLVIITATTMAFAIGSSQSEQDAIVAEIEAQKAKDILDEQALSDEERTALRKTEEEKAAKILEEEKQVAMARYQEIQDLISKINKQSEVRSLTEDEKIVLINLQDEALDLALSYELFHTVTPEEKLQSVINTFACADDQINLLYSELELAKSTSDRQSIQSEIFVAESYAKLAKDVQTKWEAGTPVDSLLNYIDIHREQILASAKEIAFGTN